MDIKVLVLMLAGALYANIPFTLLLTKWISHKDLRKEGSKSVSIANQYRVNGVGIGTLILLVEISKAYWPLLFAVSKANYLWILSAIVVGASFHLFFPGGKARTVGLWGLLYYDWRILLILCIAWGLLFFLTRKSLIASIAGAVGLVLGTLMFDFQPISLLLALFIALIIIYTTFQRTDDFSFYFSKARKE